jgi:thiamine pyrophosphokinase
MHAVILCHGEPPSPATLRRELAGADLVICTDGAAWWLEDHGVVADFVVGDMDSLSGAKVAAEAVHAGPHEAQENTDSEKAVLFALERGAREITLLGALGGRLDHSLGNIALCAGYVGRAHLRVVDEQMTLEVVSGRRELAVTPGARVSLVALSEGVSVFTEGLRWPLAEPLAPGTRGLSNIAVSDRVVLEVTGGLVAVLMFHEASE